MVGMTCALDATDTNFPESIDIAKDAVAIFT